jgi:hypothetical protein
MEPLSILIYKILPIFTILGIIISIVMLMQFDLTTVSSSLNMSILFLTGTFFANHKKLEKSLDPVILWIVIIFTIQADYSKLHSK